MPDKQWQDNAAEFALLDQGEGWPFARLVACSVEQGCGAGERTDIEPRNSYNEVGKASAMAELLRDEVEMQQ